MQQQSREEFIKAVTSDLNEAPVYFAINAKINKEGYDSLEAIKTKGMHALSISDFKKKIEEDVTILDTRIASIFTQVFVPGSIFIGLEGRFAEWAGTLISFEQRMILVTEEGMEEETIVRLARVGFDKMEGYLKGGFEAWKKAGEKIDLIIEVEPDELVMDIKHDPKLTVVDVRRETEFGDGHIKNAINLPLSEMTDVAQIARLDDDQNLSIHFSGGS